MQSRIPDEYIWAGLRDGDILWIGYILTMMGLYMKEQKKTNVWLKNTVPLNLTYKLFFRLEES